MIYWLNAEGIAINDKQMLEEIKSYVSKGGKIYIGSDSMNYTECCNFVAVIALHDCNQKIAKYFYSKQRRKTKAYKDINLKITDEVNLALQTADYISNHIPCSEIEIHIDIGRNKNNLTRKFYHYVSGWIKGTSYCLKIKPDSWASHLADWHTK